MRRRSRLEKCDAVAPHISNDSVTSVRVKAFYMKINRNQLNGSSSEQKIIFTVESKSPSKLDRH